jgi:hypothetical protein
MRRVPLRCSRKMECHNGHSALALISPFCFTPCPKSKNKDRPGFFLFGNTVSNAPTVRLRNSTRMLLGVSLVVFKPQYLIQNKCLNRQIQPRILDWNL